MTMPPDHTINTSAELDLLYGAPSERARQKQKDQLDVLHRQFIALSPFLLLTSSGPLGLDCSPRGDQPGFAQVADAKTLLIPDRRGNNRIDSLRNIVSDPRVGLLFLIPGLNECLRVNGRASISVAPVLLQRFVLDGEVPKIVLVVDVEQAFTQNVRAIHRAALWANSPTTDEARRSALQYALQRQAQQGD